MSNRKKRKEAHRSERRWSVRGVQRGQPDVKKVSEVLAALAIAQAEKEAEAEHHRQSKPDQRRSA